MKIYGIYDMKENEQCIRVGPLREIIRFLNISARESTRMFNCFLRNRYKVMYLFTEKGE